MGQRVAGVPQDRQLPSRRPAPRRAVRELPHQRRGEGHADEVLRLPLGAAPGRSLSDPAGADCETCHRPVSWTAVTWNHGAATGMPLSPAHRTLGCDSCHTNRRFDAGSPSCYSCHAKDYQATTQPNHAAAGFPTPCEVCHKPSHTSFTQASFHHNAYFPLAACTPRRRARPATRTTSTRARRATASGATGPTTTARANPNHAAAGFPTTCESCHRPTDASWKATFNHSARSRWSGCTRRRPARRATRTTSTRARRATASAATARTTTAPRARTTRRPASRRRASRATGHGHELARAPSTTTRSSRSSACTRRRPARRATRTTSTRARRATASAATARTTSARRARTTRRPDSRRRASRATAPRRRPGRRVSTTTGSSCWPGAICRHRAVRATGTTSTGARRASAIRATRRSTTRTTNPNHRAAGFPTTCETCHRNTDTSWNQGRFNHTWFPITSGRHAGRACAACHHDPNNYKVFTLHDLPHPGEDGRRARGPRRVPVRLGRLLLVPPDGAGTRRRPHDTHAVIAVWRSRSCWRSRPCPRPAGAQLSRTAPAAAVPATAAPTAIPRWARVSFFAQRRVDDGRRGSSSTFSELVTNVAAQSVQHAGNGFEYGLDLRFGAYPSTEERDPRVSIYDAYVGAAPDGRPHAREGRPDVAERPRRPRLGRRRPRRVPAERRRASACAGGPAGSAASSRRSSTRLRLGRQEVRRLLRARRQRRPAHVVGYVNVRNQNLTERPS